MWGWGRREAGCTKRCAGDSSLAALGLTPSWTLCQALPGAGRSPDRRSENRVPPRAGAWCTGSLLALGGSGPRHKCARHEAVRENHLQGTSRTAGPSSSPALHPTNSTTAYPGTGDTGALLERRSNGTDLAGGGRLACSQPRSLPGSPRPFPHVPHPARSPDEPGSPAVLTQLLSTSCSRSPRHSRLRGPQQMEAQPCWASCCSNTCAQDQVQLAGGHYKEESRIQCPAVQGKQSTWYNLVLPPPEQQGWDRRWHSAPALLPPLLLQEHHVRLVQPTLPTRAEPDQR